MKQLIFRRACLALSLTGLVSCAAPGPQIAVPIEGDAAMPATLYAVALDCSAAQVGPVTLTPGTPLRLTPGNSYRVLTPTARLDLTARPGDAIRLEANGPVLIRDGRPQREPTRCY
ncbi:MAG: hypothetical protein CSA72_09480 [Rhodobacterales bacterium]|nr:MAG: hypothetical protein CSA72_09480 [Rhodobacterales bacterium]